MGREAAQDFHFRAGLGWRDEGWDGVENGAQRKTTKAETADRETFDQLVSASEMERARSVP